MHPVLFSWNDFSMPTYGLLYLTAFLAAIFTGGWLGSRNGIPFWRMIDIAFIAAISGEVGARLMFVIVEWPRFRDGAITASEFLVAGRVVLAGVVLGAIGFVVIVRRFGYSLFRLCDIGVVSIPLGMGIGRLGCFFGGCCYGRETDLGWGITFTHPLAHRINGTPLGVPLHPTQLLQAVEGVVWFGVLLWVFHHRKFNGQVFGLFWIVTGVSRFLMEFLRGDARGAAAGLTTSQWIGLASVAFGMVWYAAGRLRAGGASEAV